MQVTPLRRTLVACSALTLLVGQQEGHLTCKKRGDGGSGHWLVRMERRPAGWSVGLSASVNPPLHHKVQKFSSGTILPGWSRKKGRKTDVCVCVCFSTNMAISETRSMCRNPNPLDIVESVQQFKHNQDDF